MKTLMWTLCALLGAQIAQARPTERHELTPSPGFVDMVGDVDNAQPPPSKAANDTIWIATWNFEGCDDTGWVRADNRILNDGNVYWSVNDNYAGIANIVDEAASVGTHELCYETPPYISPDHYSGNWYQAIRIQYVGDSFLSFDYLVDSEGGFDFLQVETDSACSSFGQVNYDVDPLRNAQSFRNLAWSATGWDTVTARVDSIALPGYASSDTHCAYIAFFSNDDGFDPTGTLQISVLNVGAVVDNVALEGTLPTSEDFTNFTPSPWFSFVNLAETTPFGAWARTFRHITDNDLCTENLTCAWLATDHTTPTFAKDPSMDFGPGGYVIKNWLDETLVGPWVSLSSTSTAFGTTMQFRRFGGNTFSTGRIVQNWSIRGRARIANSDTPAAGDSLDCVSGWGHTSQWNSLSTFEWRTESWDATNHFDPSSSHVQVRFRVSDWQWIAGAAPPSPFNPGPGPFWDRVRIGRTVLTGPVIDEGIDARYQAQDAAPNDPTHDAGPLYAQQTGPDDIFGTTAFSSSADLGAGTSNNLIVGDSITVEVEDILGAGIDVIEFHASIVSGPHVGKSPAPYTVGPNGFFTVPVDSSRDASGTWVAGRFFVDLDDTYFRGGDCLRYFWWATDQLGGAASLPEGMTALPTSLQQAEYQTGGLFEVNFLPSIYWDVAYYGRIAADPHGDLEPTPAEIAQSSQENCVLYYHNVNTRRRSSDLNRTSFMYTLDKLGYTDWYDVYDHMGLGNTNNHLGARMSAAQARNYALIIYDAGNPDPGAPILPDGLAPGSGKIDMSGWFQTWNSLSGGPNPEHALWILGANVLEESPNDPLYASMGVSFVGADQGQDPNPDVFAIADFTTHTGCVMTHGSTQFALKGGCPVLRDYDTLGATGTGVVTHVYGKGSPSAAGAIVMNANAGGYTTIASSFPWFDIRNSIGQNPTRVAENLMARILGCALPGWCPTTGGETDTGPPQGDGLEIPIHTALHQNTPNPFNPMTTIRFDLAHDDRVSLRIYDVAGRLVRVLDNELIPAGYNRQILWNGRDDAGKRVASGVYFYRLEAGAYTATRKLVVMK